MEGLLKPENKQQLVSVLTCHVTPGKLMSNVLSGGPAAAKTVSGKELPMSYVLHANEASVVTPDIECSNGVVHVIDAVLLPPAQAEPAEAADIVDTAVAAGQFNTLVAAVKAAGLVETLKGDGPPTVFAPTGEAFGELPAGTVEDLLNPENKDKLTSAFTCHVVAGKVMSDDLLGPDPVRALNGARANLVLRSSRAGPRS